jgi:hypothetical protein
MNCGGKIGFYTDETFADMLKTMSAKSDERLEILQNMQQQQLDISWCSMISRYLMLNVCVT